MYTFKKKKRKNVVSSKVASFLPTVKTLTFEIMLKNDGYSHFESVRRQLDAFFFFGSSSALAHTHWQLKR